MGIKYGALVKNRQEVVKFVLVLQNFKDNRRFPKVFQVIDIIFSGVFKILGIPFIDPDETNPAISKPTF